MKINYYLPLQISVKKSFTQLFHFGMSILTQVEIDGVFCFY